METEGNYVLLSSSILIAVVFGGAVFVLMYILKVMRSEQKNTETDVKNAKDFEQFNAKKDTSTIGKKKKNIDTRWITRTDKPGFSHPWLLTSLKGHTGQVLDMDFASNGKYLASCADEEPDPSDDLASGDTGGNSSSSECHKENSRSSSADPSPRAKPLSRRQRKNRRREDSSSPENKKKSKGKKATLPSPVPVVSAVSPANTVFLIANKKSLSEQYDKFWSISDEDLYRLFRSYLLSPEQRLTLGYPVECVSYPGRAIIFKSPIQVPSYPKSAYKHNKSESNSGFDVNAREFVPNMYRKQAAGASDKGSSENSSGHDSGNSTDSGEIDSEESSDSSVTAKKSSMRTYQQVLVNGPEKNVTNCVEQPISIDQKVEAISVAHAPNSADEQASQKTCVRCGVEFYMNSDNTYITQDACFYHWGKLTRVLTEDRNSHTTTSEYFCCHGKQDSRGCTEGKLHVWNGVVSGFNGPYNNYVKTRPKKHAQKHSNFGVYSLDCEMCFTGHGLELAKISVVSIDGRLVYDVYVKPDTEIVDYNSRFSGITERDLHKKGCTLKSLREVQNDLMGFVTAETILIGHGLENDLRALRIIHPNVIDTAVSFPHFNGLPYRRSLKSLISSFLKREIQTGHNGHNSYEDAKACMDLMLWRIRKDFRSILDHSYFTSQ